MNSEQAFQKQVELYRQMTGEERLAIGLRLPEFSCNIAREGIRHQHPNATPAQVEELLRERLRLSYRRDCTGATRRLLAAVQPGAPRDFLAGKIPPKTS